MCCAGSCEDTGKLLRLFPIRYRRLAKEQRFNRYDLVEMTVTKAADPRPESYRVDETSIRLIQRDKLPDAQKVRLWQPFIAPSLTALEQDNKATHRSLGIIKPDPDSLTFKARPIAESDEDDKEVANLVYQQQVSLLEEPLKPLAQPDIHFGYQFNSGGHAHWRTIQDWEVQAAYLNYQRHYGSKDKALQMMAQEYGQNIPTHNLHFIMGTMAKRRWQFILIGLLRSSLDPGRSADKAICSEFTSRPICNCRFDRIQVSVSRQTQQIPGRTDQNRPVSSLDPDGR